MDISQPKKNNPIHILIASIVVQLCLGSVYAWSTFVGPLQLCYGFTAAQTQSIFGVTIATFTVVMIIAGRLLFRYGPRRITTIAGILFIIGYLIAALSAGNFLLIFIGIGVVAGAGIGCGYVSPLATALHWYPQQRGLVLGLVVAGFGAGAVLLTTLSSLALTQGMPILQWFAWLALGYGVVLLFYCAQQLSFPHEEYLTKSATITIPRFWGDHQFWGMVLGIFCGTFAGLLVIGNLKPIGICWGMSSTIATGAVSLFAIGNAAGRIIWGWLADRWGARTMIPVMLAVGAISLAVWPYSATVSSITFLAVTVIIAFFFGGCFVLFAAQLSNCYGSEYISRIYPWVFLAYGFAALIGPMTGGWLFDLFNGYHLATFIAAAVCGVGLIGFEIIMRIFNSPLHSFTRKEMV